jgi:hypothetical protein
MEAQSHWKYRNRQNQACMPPPPKRKLAAGRFAACGCWTSPAYCDLQLQQPLQAPQVPATHYRSPQPKLHRLTHSRLWLALSFCATDPIPIINGRRYLTSAHHRRRVLVRRIPSWAPTQFWAEPLRPQPARLLVHQTRRAAHCCAIDYHRFFSHQCLSCPPPSFQWLGDVDRSCTAPPTTSLAAHRQRRATPRCYLSRGDVAASIARSPFPPRSAQCLATEQRLEAEATTSDKVKR